MQSTLLYTEYFVITRLCHKTSAIVEAEDNIDLPSEQL